jgi:hypothetical protein
MPLSESFAQNPAALIDRQAAAAAKATTTLSWQGDRAVVTYPIPGVAGATATATLDGGFLPERIFKFGLQAGRIDGSRHCFAAGAERRHTHLIPSFERFQPVPVH